MKRRITNLLALAVVAIATTACCCKKECDKAADACCAQSADTTKTYAMYDPSQPINLNDIQIFFEADKAPWIEVTPTISRQQINLNDLMTTIVVIEGPAEADPPHSHPAEQISYIAEGRCIVFIGDQSKELKKGDVFAVPSNIPHTVQALDERLVLIDAFNPIRQEFLQK